MCLYVFNAPDHKSDHRRKMMNPRSSMRPLRRGLLRMDDAHRRTNSHHRNLSMISRRSIRPWLPSQSLIVLLLVRLVHRSCSPVLVSPARFAGRSSVVQATDSFSPNDTTTINNSNNNNDTFDDLSSRRLDHSLSLFLTHGPIIVDADDGQSSGLANTCNIEDLDLANESQLYTILHDLTNTRYFRRFRVDLTRHCPLQSWRLPDKQHATTTTAGSGPGSAPIANASDRHHTRATTHDATPEGILFPADRLDAQEDNASIRTTSEYHVSDEGALDDSFECDGGAVGHELDDDAEPLCGVVGSTNPFDSNALFSMAQTGFASQDQKDAFSWSRHSDTVVVVVPSSTTTDASTTNDDETAAAAVSPVEAEDCGNEDGMLPDSFWVDLCAGIGGLHLDDDIIDHRRLTTTATPNDNIVDLALNPERNTGYNGTHIWRAIYEENCLQIDGSVEHQCLEERVLYRLLSGLHTSTTLSIATHYYPPSKKKGRTHWEPNPTYFVEQFKEHPDRIRNLYFSYVVLLRALQKASPFLYDYNITSNFSNESLQESGMPNDDETASILLRRLLDSRILQSCSSIFSAFDESVMFQGVASDNPLDPSTQIVSSQAKEDVVSLQKNFKGVFHNVSSILDCVQCQQCKLHGKLTMLGYGTALKILFLPMELWPSSLMSNEIVAFINTIAKLSNSVREVRQLTALYRDMEHKQHESKADNASTSTYSTVPSEYSNMAKVDTAIAAISKLGNQKLISVEKEVELVQHALRRSPDLIVLVTHYGNNPEKLGRMLQLLPEYDGTNAILEQPANEPDAIVVGSGLAGLAAALQILDRGGRVIVLEKERTVGGNSNKASSGINAYRHDNPYGDSLDLFRNDTTRSAGASAHLDLIETLVSRSESAVTWLRDRVGVDLTLLAQLGGHSATRTHRPSNGMAGAEIIFHLQRAVRKYEATGQAEIVTGARVIRLITEVYKTADNALNDQTRRVVGVEYAVSTNDVSGNGRAKIIRAPHVILATGGFASDRSEGSYLHQYRPEYMKLPATAGPFSTGDGIALAIEQGAVTRDMDKVQLHPTGWVDPADPANPSKTLAAELMRGVGGLLLNSHGERFCNELGNRAYVTDRMLSHDVHYASSGEWSADAAIQEFSLVLSSAAARDAQKHVDLYSHKGLLTKVDGIDELARWMHVPKATLVSTFRKYQSVATNTSTGGVDEFGKNEFRGCPNEDLDSETFYVGKVTPVLHYCMGGIAIDTEGNVLDGNGVPIPGLLAAGEVTGGVHGANRLGGNSLLECTVYGSIVGQKVPIRAKTEHSFPSVVAESYMDESKLKMKDATEISISSLAAHDSPDDCWVGIHGVVYDLTEFADEHPAGPESIHVLCGQDGSEAFVAVHNAGLLDDFDDERKGVLVLSTPAPLLTGSNSSASAQASPSPSILSSIFSWSGLIPVEAV